MGSTLFVDKHASGHNDGTSWQDAFIDLQSALRACDPGDEIWVARGEYRPGRDREATFTLKDRIGLYGGFEGNESARDERDVGRHHTVLSGNIGDRDVSSDNVYRVVSGTNLSTETMLDGFTISGAYNDRPEELARGGGLYIVRSDLQIARCSFLDNFGAGGGVWNEMGRPSLRDCVFLRNERSAFTNYMGNPSFLRCRFLHNVSSSGDGGAYNGGSTYLTPVFRQCLFYHNYASAWGGAYYGVGDPLFDGCLFVGNYAETAAGAVYLRAGKGRVFNCAFFKNEAGRTVGGLGNGSQEIDPVLANCLFWGNTAAVGSVQKQQLSLREGNKVDYSCVQGWDGTYGGVGNHGLDPRFVDFDGSDYRLTAGSPCIDAGDNEAVTEPFDLDGNPRILSDVVDMGAYESVCDEVTKLKPSCKGEPGAGKLVAKLRTSLPGGSTVMLRCDDGRSTPAAIKESGRGKARWHNQTGPVEVCPSGCPDACREVACP